MKIKKQITIVADILVDEDFDTDYLCICEDISDQTNLDGSEIFVGASENFEVLDYVSQNTVEIVENPLDTITDNAFDLEDEKNET